jgi:tetratricopeptide (TPR) repeat protein
MEDGERNLQAALGYLHLGMAEDAAEELDQLPPRRAEDLVVLRVRAHIHSELHAWDALRETAALLTTRAPQDSQHWIWLAYATRRCRSVREAESILQDALRFHEREALIHFNLACYAAVTGRTDLARTRLAEAIRLEPSITAMAVVDPDLATLW